MISVRWRPPSWMQFSSLFFFLNRPWHGPTTDDRSDEFPDGWLPSNHSAYGVCECKHAISNTPSPQKITSWKIGRVRRPRHVSETGNEVPEKHVSKRPSPHCYMYNLWLILKWPTQRKRMPTNSHPHPPRHTTEYYPLKRCQVPVGHPVLKV